MQTLTHVFFDVGGVLGSNGWDREQRARAVARFALDPDFEHRHHEVVGSLETGAMSLSVCVWALTRATASAVRLSSTRPKTVKPKPG